MKVTYLFDPLCGWCYGASPAIQKLGQHATIQLELAPTGLFAGTGGRTMDAAFADYAWSNDVRIEKLTGQRFTEDYRTQVLGKPGSRFDSATTTLALTAVALTAPAARVGSLEGLAGSPLRARTGYQRCARGGEAAARHGAGCRCRPPDRGLMRSYWPPTQRASKRRRGLMQSFGAQGVPALIVTDDNGSRLLRGNALYGSFDSLLTQLTEA